MASYLDSFHVTANLPSAGRDRAGVAPTRAPSRDRHYITYLRTTTYNYTPSNMNADTLEGGGGGRGGGDCIRPRSHRGAKGPLHSGSPGPQGLLDRGAAPAHNPHHNTGNNKGLSLVRKYPGGHGNLRHGILGPAMAQLFSTHLPTRYLLLGSTPPALCPAGGLPSPSSRSPDRDDWRTSALPATCRPDGRADSTLGASPAPEQTPRRW
jgi:hypothetical protein